MIDDALDTALWVAKFRALESERTDALFHDPYAGVRAGVRGRVLAAGMPPEPLAWSLAVKTRIFDKLIMKLVGASKVSLVVNLGAGLDARPFRLDLPNSLTWIEADSSRLLQHKDAVLPTDKAKCRLARVPCDLNDPIQRSHLLESMDPPGDALVIAEGELPYLTETTVAALANDLFTCPALKFWSLELMSPSQLARQQRARRFGREMPLAAAVRFLASILDSLRKELEQAVTFAILVFACSLGLSIGCSRPADRIQSPTVVTVPAAHATGGVPGIPPPLGTAPVSTTSASASPSAPTTPFLCAIAEGDMKWVRGLRRMRAFRVFDMAQATGPALAVNWLVYPSRKVHAYPNEREDYPGNYVRKLELVVSFGDTSQSIALGEHSGAPGKPMLTACTRRGYGPPDEEAWEELKLPNLVSTLSVGDGQGTADFLLLRGAGALYLLASLTHDGSCPILIHQGPLETCADMPWKVLAEIRISNTPTATESVSMLDEAGRAAPFDCSGPSN